jgi:hypothetical protein
MKPAVSGPMKWREASSKLNFNNVLFIFRKAGSLVNVVTEIDKSFMHFQTEYGRDNDLKVWFVVYDNSRAQDKEESSEEEVINPS